MTIQEFYAWAVRNGVENYDLRTDVWCQLREIDIKIDNDYKEVII